MYLSLFCIPSPVFSSSSQEFIFLQSFIITTEIILNVILILRLAFSHGKTVKSINIQLSLANSLCFGAHYYFSSLYRLVFATRNGYCFLQLSNSICFCEFFLNPASSLLLVLFYLHYFWLFLFFPFLSLILGLERLILFFYVTVFCIAFLPCFVILFYSFILVIYSYL